MKIVKCFTQEFFDTKRCPVVEKIVGYGEPIPKIGKEYTVESTYFKGEETFYALEEIDWSDYNVHIHWNSKCFEIVSNEYRPDTWVDSLDGLAELHNFIIEIELPSNLEFEEATFENVII